MSNPVPPPEGAPQPGDQAPTGPPADGVPASDAPESGAPAGDAPAGDAPEEGVPEGGTPETAPVEGASDSAAPVDGASDSAAPVDDAPDVAASVDSAPDSTAPVGGAPEGAADPATQPGFPQPGLPPAGFPQAADGEGHAPKKSGARTLLIRIGAAIVVLVVVLLARTAIFGDKAGDAKVGDCIAAAKDVSKKETTETSAKVVDCDSSDAKFSVVARVDGQSDVNSTACEQHFKEGEAYYTYASKNGKGYLLCLRPKA